MKAIKEIYLHKAIGVCICLFALAVAAYGEGKTDTIRIHALREVSVKGDVHPSSSRSTSPVQVLQGDVLSEKLNALLVSDAVKFFSGVQVKDYGGVGGLKTVSVRSLGAGHTTVAYDGAALSDYQTGQLDLGRFSLNNVEALGLYTGTDDDIFQSARIQSSASVLKIESKKTRPENGRRMSTGITYKSGSFGLVNLSVFYNRALSEVFSVGIAGEWLHTDGNYPYTSGSGERKKRAHSEVENLKLETNLSGRLNNGGRLSLKVYGYHTERSLPGPDIYYANSPGEWLNDKQFFSQASYEQAVSDRINIRSIAKFDIAGTHYTSFGNSYAAGKKESVYDQWEYYVSQTVLYSIAPAWSVSWANDGSYAGFGNQTGATDPTRTVWQSALSSEYRRPRFTARATLIGSYSHDEVAARDFSEEAFDLSSYAGLSLQPLKRYRPLRIRVFYKESFRQPTFSDLYAAFVPAQNLKPEKAHQLNLGLSWTDSFGALFPCISVTADAYRNKIDRKIVSYPTSSMFFWSVQNLDKVEVTGIDINGHLQIDPLKDVSCRLGVAGTWQNVLDKTDPAGRMYNQQIRYTPRRSGSAYLQASWRQLDVNYTLIYSGKRYYERINRPQYAMEAYTDQTFSISKRLYRQKIAWTFSVEGLNITDRRYEVVRSYPMPGRSFGMKVQVRY
jgi:outer membrane cobalamin receptor